MGQSNQELWQAAMARVNEEYEAAQGTLDTIRRLAVANGDQTLLNDSPARAEIIRRKFSALRRLEAMSIAQRAGEDYLIWKLSKQFGPL